MDYSSFQPVNPNTNPVPQIPQQEPSKHFTPKFMGVIVSILVIGGAAYGSLWYWQEQFSEVVIPTFTPRPGDEIADWQPYRNEKHGFEFQYPSSQVFEEREGKDGKGAAYFYVTVDTKENLEFTCDACDGPSTFFEVMRYKPEKNPVENCFSPPEGEISKITIGGVLGDKCVADGLHGPTLSIYLTKDKVTFFSIIADNYSGQQKLLIDQILSSFTFTNSVDTSAWKKYTNTKYGYSLEYPPTWDMNNIDANKDIVEQAKLVTWPSTSVGIIDGNYSMGGEFELLPNYTNYPYYVLRFQIMKPDPSITLDQFMNSFVRPPITKESITINNRSALRFTDTVSSYMNGGVWTAVLIKGNGLVYMFSYLNPPESFSSVVNTFKLIK